MDEIFYLRMKPRVFHKDHSFFLIIYFDILLITKLIIKQPQFLKDFLILSFYIHFSKSFLPLIRMNSQAFSHIQMMNTILLFLRRNLLQWILMKTYKSIFLFKWIEGSPSFLLLKVVSFINLFLQEMKLLRLEHDFLDYDSTSCF